MKLGFGKSARPSDRPAYCALTLKITLIAPLAVALGLGACETVDKTMDALRDATPRERYEVSLEAAGLAETALARDWAEAGRDALANPTPVGLPFDEVALITPEDPKATGYLVSLGRGRRLTVDVSVDGSVPGDHARVFVELYRVPNDTSDAFRPVANADSMPWSLEYEPWRGGEFVLRVQPELLRGGSYTVRLSHEAQLEFPVAGHDTRSILSFFGAPRDGGRRRHHGVDVFATRGTPVLAASAGLTYRVRETPVGGKVVWVRDSVRQASVYYAHLDSQTVHNDQWVEAGDTIGFVGNTGNAHTTPPHLHFGLYRRGGGPDRGPIDPLPFLETPPGRPLPQTADPTLLGGWVRTVGDAVNLRAAPTGPVVASLQLYAEGRVLASAGGTYRVELQDGRQGYISATLVEPRSTLQVTDFAEDDPQDTGQ